MSNHLSSNLPVELDENRGVLPNGGGKLLRVLHFGRVTAAPFCVR
jgi:hypothetical protein